MPVMLSGIEPSKSTETPVRVEPMASGDESAFGDLMRGMLAPDEPSSPPRRPASRAGRHKLPLELGLSAEDSGTENPETPPDDSTPGPGPALTLDAAVNPQAETPVPNGLSLRIPLEENAETPPETMNMGREPKTGAPRNPPEPGAEAQSNEESATPACNASRSDAGREGGPTLVSTVAGRPVAGGAKDRTNASDPVPEQSKAKCASEPVENRESAAPAKEVPPARAAAPSGGGEAAREEQAEKFGRIAVDKAKLLAAQAEAEVKQTIRRPRGSRAPARAGPAVRAKPDSNGPSESKTVEKREAAESARPARDLSVTEQPSGEARPALDAAIVNHPGPGAEREPNAQLAQGFQLSRLFAPPSSAATFQRGISQALSAPPSQNAVTIERIHELMDRFDDHVLSLASGKDKTMTITLVPDNLGKVVLSCRENGARMSVEIVAENHVVRNLIQEHETGLRQALEQQGYKMDAFDVKTQGDDAGARSFERRAPERDREDEASPAWPGRMQGAPREPADFEPRAAWMPAGSGGLWVVA